MITNIDLGIMMFVQENLRSEIGNAIMKFITHLGDGGWLWIAIGVALLLFKKTIVAGFSVLISLAINALFTNITLKDLIARPRPFVVNDAIVPLVGGVSPYRSFPSGHSGGSFAAMLALSKWVPKKIGIPAIILAAMVALSRLYVGVHYPTDILGGFVVGLVCSFAAYRIVKYVMRKREEKIADV